MPNDTLKTGEMVRMRMLEPRDLDAVAGLHDLSLRAAQNGHLQPQSERYFAKLLAGDGGCMIGIQAETANAPLLVAQLALCGPFTVAEIKTRNLIALNHVVLPYAAWGDRAAAIKSKAVHPDWQGKGLSPRLLNHARDQARAWGIDQCFAQISLINRRSWINFLKSGFGVAAVSRDRVDGKERMVLQRPVEGFRFSDNDAPVTIDPTTDFARVAPLTLERGLVGMWNADNKRESAPTLVFRRPRAVSGRRQNFG